MSFSELRYFRWSRFSQCFILYEFLSIDRSQASFFMLTIILPLKKHFAMDRSSLSLKSVCYRLNALGSKDVLKVEYSDPRKHASKLHDFLLPRRRTRSAVYESRVKCLTPINGQPS